MSWWEERVLPRITDKALGVAHIAGFRARVCAGLRGEVVEIGFGSGLNVPHYPSGVTGVAAVEPSDLAWRLAQRRVATAKVPVRRVGLDGQRLPLPDSSYDSALSTFTMCTVPDLDAALRELARVLAPGGSLHFLEHGLAPDAGVVRWQHRLQPIQGRVAGGCHLGRPILDALTRNGFEVAEVDTFYAGRPRAFTYLYLGRASARHAAGSV
ncbi:MAG TPA: class I SAM-dependent methyltransferase [Nocardioidaceae bacterium]|nr:class I SAM-dependent methyltransferase [Nocardioidaceae bacterium]